ncbi:unnamed protein product [Mesocestoides corti]|uniref:RING-type E3 ubiquitin transferase n=1 Tax=Mesocestoides corti TaxID=53468 RepID=A0A158QUX8_MESCO|nr:unnamed protein product [Mesocestoides corti]
MSLSDISDNLGEGEAEVVRVDGEWELVPTCEVDDVDVFEKDEEYCEDAAPGGIGDQSMVDESGTCMICFESWTTSGPHRICCLRCGHLFGRSCVIKWLNMQGAKAGKCPQCNAKAQTRDIRVLFCKKITAVDTTDRDRALHDLEVERKLRKKAELELSECKFKLQLASCDAEQLRAELTDLRTIVAGFKSVARSSVSTTESKKLGEGNSDVGGYGLEKCISMSAVHSGEMRPLKYIHLHPQPIRDLAFHPDQQDAIVASASLDKSLKLTSLLVDQVVQTYSCPAPVWSCCWASPSPNYLFAGCANGTVLLFDIRVTSREVSVISICESSSAPVTALQYIPPEHEKSGFYPGGLLAGQLTQVTFLEEEAEGMVNRGAGEEVAFRAHPLPLEGSLVSLSCLGTRRSLFLASYRPSTRVPRVRHLFSELTVTRSGADHPCSCDCKEIVSLFGGTQMRMLSRARVFHQEQSNQILAVAGDDDTGGALVWSCETGSRLQTLHLPTVCPSPGPVIDVCAFNNGQHLALLTDHVVNVFRWSQSSTGATGDSGIAVVECGG